MVSNVLPWDGLELSQGCFRVLDTLSEMPLASVPEMAKAKGGSASGVGRRLLELQERGLVGSEVMGWTKKRVRRWWLEGKALEGATALGGSWHEEWGRCRLMERFPSVEWFYRFVGTMKGLGPLEAFQWLEGCCVDAAARFEGGWVAFLWSGLWQTERGFMTRLDRLPYDMANISDSGTVARPSLYCVVVADSWQRELVYRVVRRYGMEDLVSVLCVTDGVVSGVRPGVDPVGKGEGWVYQPAWPKSLGGWAWPQRLERSFVVLARGGVIGRVLDTIAEWPGMGRGMARAAMGHGRKGGGTQMACKWLTEQGLVERKLEQESYRYALTSRGVDFLARRDRVNFSQSEDRSKVFSWERKPRLQAHEDGLMGLVGQFMAVGMEAATGWRSWEHLGGGGGIAPDAMVNVRSGPFGPGWHYVEYERTARGERRARSKLRGYLSRGRQDDFPILLVTWDDGAETVFQELGKEGGLPMLTTTVGRLEEFGAVKSTGCWSMYGEGVSVN